MAALARAPARGAWLLHGDETFLVERALAALKGRLLEGGTREVRTLWADDDASALASALGDLSSPLLFGGTPALVIRRAEALSGRGESTVLDAAARLRPPSCLVLVARGLDGRRALRTVFERDGGAVACPRVTDARILWQWAERLARELGHAIRPAALDLLIDRTTLDLAALASEIEKASLYAGPGVPIERDHVAAIACLGQTAAAEQVADCLAGGDRAGAHRAVLGLLRAGEPPVRLVAFLAASLRRALHVAELRERGLADETVATRLGMPGWLVRRVRGTRSAARLEQALDTLHALDLDLKRSRPPAAAFEAAVTSLTDATRRP